MTRYNSAESAPRQPTPAPFHSAQDKPFGAVHPERSEAKSKDAQDRPFRERREKAPPFLGGVFPRFIRDCRAGGTALTAALFTIMSLTGVAFASDHVWLIHQRDLLKAATDAASIAATRAMTEIKAKLTDKQVKKKLLPIAQRYILANIPEGRRERAKETLEIKLTPNRAAGTLKVQASADLGGALFGSWLWGTVVSATQVASGTERVGHADGIIEVALALDITASMNTEADKKVSRMEAMKNAALDMVDILTAGGGDSIAVGLVPWHYRVKFDDVTRTRWEDNSWARYPTQRYYPNPSKGSWKNSSRKFPDPYKPHSKGEAWNTLPAKPGPWEGCVDQRRTSGDDPPPGLTPVLPTVAPFDMGFFSPTTRMLQDSNDSTISFTCREDQWGCFEGGHDHTKSAQFNCPDVPEILPLTTDIREVKSRIKNLTAAGDSTYSTLGVIWGHRLLAPTWRTIWNDPVHPVDPSQHENVQKALVLLTDGIDNHLTRRLDRIDSSVEGRHRSFACYEAKRAGIKVFVIAAMDTNKPGSRESLIECSSQADDPDGQYVFINRTADEKLRSAFRQIAQQLVRFRRVL